MLPVVCASTVHHEPVLTSTLTPRTVEVHDSPQLARERGGAQHERAVPVGWLNLAGMPQR